MTSFQNTLWERLADQGAETVEVAPERRSGTHPYLLSAGAGAIVAAAAVAGVLAIDGSTGAPPAYAITQHHNGDVTLTMHALSGHAVAEVNSTLGHRGINATVVAARPGRCPLTVPAVPAVHLARRAPAPTTRPLRSRAAPTTRPLRPRAAAPRTVRLTTRPVVRTVTLRAAQVRPGRRAYVLARTIRGGRVTLSRALPSLPACARARSVPGRAAAPAPARR